MAEKRRLSTRGRRDPAAKRRVSEASPLQQAQPARKRRTATPGVSVPPSPSPRHESVSISLPAKIKDGEGLPTLSMPQPSNLSPDGYQSIAESAVLLASLERSKKKWLSDGILERYWTKPKKTKREQLEGKNPPKESMSKIGGCNIVIGPHIFDAMLYTVKDPNAQYQSTPPQRQMVHYGPYGSNNFQQYQPYPAPTPPPPHPPPPPPAAPQARQFAPYVPIHSASRPPVPQSPVPQPSNHSSPLPQQPKSVHSPHLPPPTPPSAGQPQPLPLPPPAQPGQALSPSQPPQTPQTPQPAKPSPDPVIQMLATRAASDPELKALMRVVASSKASQDQLRTFQAHIDDLNAIIRTREQQRQQSQMQGLIQPQPRTPQAVQQPSRKQSQPQQRPVQPQQAVPVAAPSRSGSGSQTPVPNLQNSNETPQLKEEPDLAPNYPPLSTMPTPSETMHSSISNPEATSGPPLTPGPPDPQFNTAPRPSPQSYQTPQQIPTAPRPSPQYPIYQAPPPPPPPVQSRPPPQHGPPVHYYRPVAPPPPPKMNYKSVVLEFTSPLTPYGSSTSGHAGSGDRYLFPEYSILDWLPGGNAVIVSFLLVRRVDPNAPFPIETAPETVTARGKAKAPSKSKKGTKEKEKEKGKEKPAQKGKKAKSQSQAPSPSPSTPIQQKFPENVNGSPTETQVETSTMSIPISSPDNNIGGGGVGDTETSPNSNPNSNLKEFYQPVTIRIISHSPKILEPLSRVVKPADQVRAYMNDIMDRAERAPEGFLAYRLPREDSNNKEDEKDAQTQTQTQMLQERDVNNHHQSREGGTPVSSTHTGRPSRAAKQKSVGIDVDSGAENNSVVEEGNGGGGGGGGGGNVEEEEELKDYYGPPTGFLV